MSVGGSAWRSWRCSWRCSSTRSSRRFPRAHDRVTSIAGHVSLSRRIEWRFGWNVIFHYFTNGRVMQRPCRHAGTDGARDDRRHRVRVSSSPSCDCRTVDCFPARPGRTRGYFGVPRCYVQLLLWGYIASLYPDTCDRHPVHPRLPRSLRSEFGLHTLQRRRRLALGLNEGAYFSEIVRAGLIAVDEGQTEAATSLGMTRGQTLRLVVLAAGDARHHSSDWQRSHLDVEDDVARRRSSASSTCSARSRTSTARTYQIMPMLHARESVVLDRVDGSVDRTVLSRATLRERCSAHSAAHADPAAPTGPARHRIEVPDEARCARSERRP